MYITLLTWGIVIALHIHSECQWDWDDQEGEQHHQGIPYGGNVLAGKIPWYRYVPVSCKYFVGFNFVDA